MQQADAIIREGISSLRLFESVSRRALPHDVEGFLFWLTLCRSDSDILALLAPSGVYRTLEELVAEGRRGSQIPP